MEMWSAKLTSSANCSDFLPNPDSRLTDLHRHDHLLSELRNETSARILPYQDASSEVRNGTDDVSLKA